MAAGLQALDFWKRDLVQKEFLRTEVHFLTLFSSQSHPPKQAKLIFYTFSWKFLADILQIMVSGDLAKGGMERRSLTYEITTIKFSWLLVRINSQSYDGYTTMD